MINSVAALKRAINDRKVKFKQVNLPEPIERDLGDIIQTNAFTIKRLKNGNYVNSYVWYEHIKVVNGIMSYKGDDKQEFPVYELIEL